ncbi:uncharacterized protein [Haliotis asinina]|uniref:uncharacterized protein n=1 Tax=Haliotis asinina TaxID=109174 RepID=UPI0035323110
MADLAAKEALNKSMRPLLTPYSDYKVVIRSYIRDIMQKKWDTQPLMSAILVAAVSLCALSLALQASNDDCSHPPMHEVVLEKAHGYIHSVVAHSMYDCAAECKRSLLCLSFIFDLEKRTCEQLSVQTKVRFEVGSGVFFSSAHDWKMSLTGACGDASCGANSRCTLGRNGLPLCDIYDNIGMKCTRDDDCHTPMTFCFRGLCLCHPGYSHNITSNTCDRDCKRFGNTMTLYKGLGIKYHNRKRVLVFGEFEDAVKMCTTACVEETTFVCKTADLRPPRGCYLSSDGYLDASPSERERNLSQWWMAVRTCL